MEQFVILGKHDERSRMLEMELDYQLATLQAEQEKPKAILFPDYNVEETTKSVVPSNNGQLMIWDENTMESLAWCIAVLAILFVPQILS